MDTEKYITISDLNNYIKNIFEDNLYLRNVYLKGEISNFKNHTRGHLYFTLKDEDARLSAVMFAGSTKTLQFKPEDGMKVLVRGRISVYPATGSYQIYVEEMTLDGVGNLYIEFEKLKEKLYKEGLFNKEHKKLIPRFPERIGVITADTGAAVRDIMSTIKRRYPLCEVILFPTLVQGEFAAPNIVKQISVADNYNCDVLIVGRGGGSIEDLWAFNEEIVARAIYSANTPIISAVGHEPDFTIADFVADLRAPTPSAAAELAVADIKEVKEKINTYKARASLALKKKLEYMKLLYEKAKQSPAFTNPTQKINENYILLDNLIKKLENSINIKIKDVRSQSAEIITKLDTLSPLKTLTRGYSLVEKDGNIINSVNNLNKDDKITIKFNDGTKEAKIL